MRLSGAQGPPQFFKKGSENAGANENLSGGFAAIPGIAPRVAPRIVVFALLKSREAIPRIGFLTPRIIVGTPRAAPRIPRNSPRAPRMAFPLRERFTWNWGGPQASEPCPGTPLMLLISESSHRFAILSSAVCAATSASWGSIDVLLCAASRPRNFRTCQPCSMSMHWYAEHQRMAGGGGTKGGIWKGPENILIFNQGVFRCFSGISQAFFKEVVLWNKLKKSLKCPW